MKIAVVTGASSGMGKDFVYALEENYKLDEIWLIARSADKLKEIAESIQTKTKILPLDLSDMNSIEEYKKNLEEIKPEISVSVNDAGFGKFNYFPDVELETYYNMIDLNTKAYVGMLYVSLPYMKSGSEVYMLGSMSAFQPVPYINIYGATKAFVVSFSRALNAELQPLGIKAMAVCPLWVETAFFDRAVNDDTITYYNYMYKSKDVVAKALKDMKKGKDLSVLGFGANVQRVACKLLPHKLVMKVWLKQQKKL